MKLVPSTEAEAIATARRGLSALCCLFFLAFLATPVMADAPVLPSTGVDIAAWVPVVATGLGTIVAAIVGTYFSFLLVKVGLKWSRRAFS